MQKPSKIKKQKFKEISNIMSIYYQDESSFEISQKMWRILVEPKGKAYLKWYEKRHESISVSWAYSTEWDFMYRSKKSKKATDFLSFLYQLRYRQKKKRIILIVDNARIHHAKIVKKYCSENNIMLVYLPPYSPEHNPIEFLWKHIKRAFQKIQRKYNDIKKWIKQATKKAQCYYKPLSLPTDVLSLS